MIYAKIIWHLVKKNTEKKVISLSIVLFKEFSLMNHTREKSIPILVENREESAITGDEIYIPAEGGEEIHHQSRMFIVPQIYYDKSRTLFQFFNLEYLEADGHFILRIIATNAR